MERIFYKDLYESLVKNFALNLVHIWEENSAGDLKQNPRKSGKKDVGIIIGWGPSLRKHKHLQMLADSKFSGKIICSDAALAGALEAGVTPDKFKKFYVITIDPKESIQEFYEPTIVKKYGNEINGIFSTVVHPETVQQARNSNIKINWLHPLLDYNKGKKSFNQIAATIVRARKHLNGLPAIQTGGNVGTSAWFVAWQILGCNVIGLIGFDHSWSEDDPWEKINTHGFTCDPIISNSNKSIKEKLFPKLHNPEFGCNFVLDPIYQYYSAALKEFISRSPKHVITINATEGGSIFGERITCTTFSKFLEKYS